MARRWRAGAVAALMVGSLLGAAPAQAATPAPFQGTITDAETGAPVAGACVALFRTPLAADTEVCTDNSGRYTVTDAVAGAVYRLRARAEGYADRWHPRGVDFVSSIRATAGTTEPTVIDFAITRRAGTLRGKITRQDGSPASMVSVYVFPVGENTFTHIYTRDNGEYRFDQLPAGHYQIEVAGSGYPPQWVPKVEIRLWASIVTVTPGGETVVDEQFRVRSPMPPLNAGVLAGTVIAGATNAPVADACVTIYRNDWATAADTCVEPDGTYRALLPVGQYRVVARSPGNPDVWAPSASSYGTAAVYSVAKDATVTADVVIGDVLYESIIRGRIIDYTGTAPTESVSVTATSTKGTWSLTTRSAPDGSYEFTRLPAGGYRLSAMVNRRVSPTYTVQKTQWFPQKFTAAQAQVVTVGVGEVVTVDETLIAPAIVNITLVDEETDVPVTTACVHIAGQQQCGAPDGVYHFPHSWSYGTTSAVVYPGPQYFEQRVEGIPVSPGEVTSRTIRLRPGGSITATVARVDGSLPRVCAHAVPVAFGATWLPGSASIFCNTDGQGGGVDTVTLGPLLPGTYQIFVAPARLETYGVQWLGDSGGTGDRRVAAQIDVRLGKTASAPVIKVDPAGAIAGTLRNQSTGAPLAAGKVRPFGMTRGLQMICTNGAFYTGCTGSDGSYRLDGLGPYAWPVEFAAPGHASQWSGGAADRFGAKLIPVTAGQTTKLDASLGPEGQIETRDRGPDAPASWSANAFNAVTGDLVGSAVYHNPPVIGGLNTGPVLIEYRDYAPGAEPCWYYRTMSHTNGGRQLVSSPVVQVTVGQTITGVALIPGSTCRPEAPNLGSKPLPDLIVRPVTAQSGPTISAPSVMGDAPKATDRSVQVPALTGATADPRWQRAAYLIRRSAAWFFRSTAG